MTVIGVDRLLQLVKDEKLVENLSERELTNPEGAGFDIRAGEAYRISGQSFLGVTQRHTPESEMFAQEGKDKDFTLRPGDYVLVKTMESFNVPKDVTMHTFPRSTLHRSGVLLLATQTAPGYSGPLVFGLKNLGDCTVRIEFGARIAHVQFLQVEGGTNAYRGQWKGGRVTETKTETQV
jgi:deoxycytidine triphosphate deaminase